MNYSTATHQLKKKLMLKLAKQCGMSYCYRCGKEIETAEDLSVDHKESWLNSENPVKMFWDVDNLAFSHRTCNSDASHRRLENRGATKLRKKFQSRYWDRTIKKQVFVGNFDTAEEASEAAQAAKLKNMAL